jgi:hypothetical protein
MHEKMTLVWFPTPHEFLEGLAEGAEGVTRSQQDGMVVYAGTLSDAALEQVSPARRLGRARGGQQPDVQGTFELYASPQGHVEKIVLDVTVKASGQNSDFERTTRSVISLADVGACKVEVPAEADAELGGTGAGTAEPQKKATPPAPR